MVVEGGPPFAPITGCYSSHNTPMTWSAAEIDCRSRGGHLVWIETTQEWSGLAAFMVTSLSDPSGFKHPWVGAKAAILGTGSQEGARWEWGSGDEM